jgi:hypothetical protein
MLLCVEFVPRVPRTSLDERRDRRQQHASGTAVQGGRRCHTEAAGPHLSLRRPCARDRPPVDWLEVVARAGYYDQAHFGNDFRACTGVTPTGYVDVRRRFLREHPGHVLDVGPLPVG